MISGLVLAAGASTRLGRPKQLLDLNGRPLLQHAIDSLSGAVIDEMVVVIGHAANEVRVAVALPSGGKFVLNDRYAEGQATSLATGLRAADPSADAAVVILGDQPGLTVELIEELVTRWLDKRPPVLRATYLGAPGHPVVLARGVWHEFVDATGDEGARRVLASIPGVMEVEVNTPAPIDVDTWADYHSVQNSRSNHAGEPDRGLGPDMR